MRLLFKGLILLFLALSLVSCKKILQTTEPVLPAHIVLGNNYYTQFVIRYEKNTHLTTNFRRGALIPINTRIKLLKINRKVIEVEIDQLPQPLTIKNVPKHTGDDIYQAFDKIFRQYKLNLRNFNSLERKQIKQGAVAKGMRKKAVKVAIGYPPITATPHLDSDTWVYWSGRFNKFKVNFRKGRVSSIID